MSEQINNNIILQITGSIPDVIAKIGEILASGLANEQLPASHSPEQNAGHQADQSSAFQYGMHQETANAPSVSRQHQIEQQADSRLECPLHFCQASFNHCNMMYTHMRLVHEGLHMFTCASINCGFFSTSEAERDEHELREHRQYGNQSIARERCRRCSRLVTIPMRVHIYDKHSPDGGIFYCLKHPESICFFTQCEFNSHNEKCTEKYAAITDVSEEIRDVRNRKWPCPLAFCHFGFYNFSKLQIHLTFHRRNRIIFTCTFTNCGMVFGSEAERLAHEEDRNEHRTTDVREPVERGTFCFICFRRFDFRTHKILYSHVQYIHMNGKIPFTCENHINRIFFLTREDKDAHEQKCKQMYQAIN